MTIKEEFENLLSKLSTEREEINLKLHLASMEARSEIEQAETKWQQIKTKASEIADESVETSEEFIAKAKVVSEELKESYQRIKKRLAE
jgi:hypothetical protein